MFTFDAEPKKFSEKWTLLFYMHFLMEKCLKFTGKMLTRIFSFPLMQLPFQKRLEPFESAKEAIWAAPFLISGRISKRAQLFYRVFRKLSYVNQPVFLRRKSLEKPGFFDFQKGRWLSAPIPGRSPVSGRTALFVFYEQYPVPEKGRRRKWR